MRGYDEEFTAWAQARAAALRRTAYLMCSDWHHADDLVQTVLIKVYAAWPRLERRDRLDAYARTTLVNALIDETRRPWRRERRVADVPEPTAVAVDDHGDAVAAAFDAVALLDTLPVRQRAAMVLRYWEDRPVDEVADLLGVTPGTVKSQTHKAARALRAALTEAGENR